jgi:hypothetical protein
VGSCQYRCQTLHDRFSFPSVVVRPKLNLIAPMPICGGTRIAFRTGDSSTTPEWQAEAVDAAPSRSESAA